MGWHPSPRNNPLYNSIIVDEDSDVITSSIPINETQTVKTTILRIEITYVN